MRRELLEGGVMDGFVRDDGAERVLEGLVPLSDEGMEPVGWRRCGAEGEEVCGALLEARRAGVMAADERDRLQLELYRVTQHAEQLQARLNEIVAAHAAGEEAEVATEGTEGTEGEELQQERDGARQVSEAGDFGAALGLVLKAVEQEVLGAVGKHAKFNSAHEGYAVLLEELDELKVEVWKKREARDKARMQEEAMQVAAMAVQFVLDVI